MNSIAYGRRTIPSAIDELAQIRPTRPWVSFVTDYKGLRDVSFQSCAHAVNKACWWLKRTLGTSVTFDTVAYIGPNDLRYLILFSAAVKCGYKVLEGQPWRCFATPSADLARFCSPPPGIAPMATSNSSRRQIARFSCMIRSQIYDHFPKSLL